MALEIPLGERIKNNVVAVVAPLVPALIHLGKEANPITLSKGIVAAVIGGLLGFSFGVEIHDLKSALINGAAVPLTVLGMAKLSQLAGDVITTQYLLLVAASLIPGMATGYFFLGRKK